MEEVSKKILHYLISNRIIDEVSAKELEEEIGNSKLGINDLLIEKGLFDKESLEFLLREFLNKNYLTYEQIVENFSIDSESLLKELARSLGLEYIDIDRVDINPKLLDGIPMNQLRKYGALPISEDELNIKIALKNPSDINAKDAFERIFNRKLVKIVVADPIVIERVLTKFETLKSIDGIIQDVRKELRSSAENSGEDSSAILKLIDTIIKDAIIARGSDIHVEPSINSCSVRVRIDGMLNERFLFDKDIYPPLSSRLKLLSNLDIAEKRKPQD
jgi:general secretion pathway protein E